MASWAETISDEERSALLARFERCETYLDGERKRFGLISVLPIRRLLTDSFGKAKSRRLVLACKARNAPSSGRKPRLGTIRGKEPSRRFGEDAWTLTCSGAVAVEFGAAGALVQIERMNAVIRLTAARRVARTDRDVLVVAGSVFVPIDKLEAVFAAIRTVAGLEDPPPKGRRRAKGCNPQARRGGKNGGSQR